MDAVSSSAAAFRVAVIVSRYHDFVTGPLRAGALEALAEAGCDPTGVAVVEVPGAFEIPFAAHRMARAGRIDAVVCLGCLIRGETPHFDVIAHAVATGIEAAARDTGVPMAFGVLTTESVEQAVARAGPGRANKGYEAGMAAIEMARFARRLGQEGRGPQA